MPILNGISTTDLSTFANIESVNPLDFPTSLSSVASIRSTDNFENTRAVSTPLENPYYHNFSKYVLSNTMQPSEQVEPAFTYANHTTPEWSIDKYKLPELKHVAKHYKLHVSGNKPVLVDRILSFFRQTTASIHIQSYVRGHMVRLQFRLRGTAFGNRDKCVNESDFYTLEPLREIPNTRFFSYSDEKGFHYGFDMFSLITLLKKTSKIINPYNREQIPFGICSALLSVYSISRIIFPEIFINEHAVSFAGPLPRISRPRIEPPPSNALSPPISVYEEIPEIVVDAQLPRQTVVSNLLAEIRRQSIDVRIRELFMEINLLGNYADSLWFLTLDRLRLARFYQFYYEWWNTRSRLPSSVRRNICVVGDPFPDIRLVYLYPTTDVEDYREACLRTMELMVYAGIDVEYRKLGVLQLLSMLTTVSIPARNAMPWLYESLFM